MAVILAFHFCIIYSNQWFFNEFFLFYLFLHIHFISKANTLLLLQTRNMDVHNPRFYRMFNTSNLRIFDFCKHSWMLVLKLLKEILTLLSKIYTSLLVKFKNNLWDRDKYLNNLSSNYFCNHHNQFCYSQFDK